MEDSIKSIIEEQLNKSREELLDLGMRNKLLNYRTLKSRGAKIIECDSAHVFKTLVQEEKVMYFLSAPEEEIDKIDGSQGSLLGQPDVNERNTDENRFGNKLQTPYESAELQNRLLKTYYSARRIIEEQGVNVLFIAVGMLHWFEDVNSDIERVAPLILIPVDLARKSAKAKFRVSYTGDDIGDNLSLEYKLRVEFGIKLPSLPEDIEDLNLKEYFTSVKKRLRAYKRWRVEPDEIAIGLFSFSNFLMYEDLDPTKWPEEKHPANNSVLRSLLHDGFSETSFEVPDERSLDPLLVDEKLVEVVEADSSQILALLDAKKGKNLVIQGPPGTGKSQTITNIIAEAIDNKQTVLFVSEKMAALEVVKRKLDNMAIGDSCLELHSHKSRKKDVLNELNRTFKLDKPKVEKLEQELNRLQVTVNQLNEYAEASNSRIRKSGVTAHEAFGQLTRLLDNVDPNKAVQLTITDMNEWTELKYTEVRENINTLDSKISNMGLPSEHPFWGSKIQTITPESRVNIENAISKSDSLLDDFREKVDGLADILNLELPVHEGELEKICTSANLILERPEIGNLDLQSPKWQSEKDTIDRIDSAGIKHTKIRREYNDTLIPEAWDYDVLNIRQVFMATGDKWWRWFKSDYRAAKSEFQGILKTEMPKQYSAKMEILDSILEDKRLREEIISQEDLMQNVFKDMWGGVDSNWNRLENAFQWISLIHKKTNNREVPDKFIRVANQRYNTVEVDQKLKELKESRSIYHDKFSQVLRLLEFDSEVRFGKGEAFVDHDFKLQKEIHDDWIKNIDRLQSITGLNLYLERLTKEGFHDFVTSACTDKIVANNILEHFEYGWYAKLIGVAQEEFPILSRFDRTVHEDLIKQFQELDKLILQRNRAKVALSHWQGLPSKVNVGKLGILLNEFQKKRRHLPIRKLVTEAGSVIQDIKPVMMMSPLSIAKYLPPGTIQFDVVIFDEASQVKPVDAFGALLRANQVIVVGDTKQLPPTQFFETVADDDEGEEETTTKDIESILGLFNAKGAPERMLRWHYRSKHESLIAISNSEFYDNKLVFFPSPDRERKELGLKYHYLPNTTYDRGGSRQNNDEALAVAEAVMRHAKTTPDLSLGVASFNKAQMHCILDHLEYMRRRDAAAEAFFNKPTPEPFFVKNLENVQGDQRDVVYISVGYGRDQNGKISMNFGPLNNIGGERRLNVLITRAKFRCEIFTNLQADDIRIKELQGQGIRAFKRYLKYADTGEMDIPEYTGGDFESPFERSVAKEIERLGYEVIPQVGAGGFRIDLGVIDPNNPGRFIIGVECDGATYHSAKTARDRDRIRQMVLEDMRWYIHRIWSTDWFHHLNNEVERLKNVLEVQTSKNNSLIQNHVSLNRQLNKRTEIDRVKIESSRTSGLMEGIPYKVASPSVSLGYMELHEVKSKKMADWISEVVGVESPVHIEIVGRRIIASAGITRLGRRIRQAIRRSATYASTSNMLKKEGKFLYSPNKRLEMPRDRSNLPDNERSFSYIAPYEIQLAIKKIVKASYGVDEDDLLYAISRIFGFSRLTKDMEDSIKPEIKRLTQNKEIILKNELFMVNQR